MTPTRNITDCNSCGKFFPLERFVQNNGTYADCCPECCAKILQVRKLISIKNSNKIPELDFIEQRDTILGRIQSIKIRLV